MAEDGAVEVVVEEEKQERVVPAYAAGPVVTSIPKRLFGAQKALDSEEIKDPVQLIGAMRQSLHAQQLSVVLRGWHYLDDSTVSVSFGLRYGVDEESVTLFEYRLGHFTSFQDLVWTAWKTYLHGLFGLPELPVEVSNPFVAARPGVEEPSISMPPSPIGVRPQGASMVDLLKSVQ